MSEEKKEETPTRVPAGVRQTRGGAAGARGVPAGVRKTQGAGKAGVKKTAGGPKPAAKEGEAEEAGEANAPAKKELQPAQGKLKKFLPVFIIKSENSDVTCLLCRNNLDEVCTYCMQQRITDPAQCGAIEGKCGHRFHNHCIQGWLREHNNCPYPGCDTRWENA